MGVGQQQLGVHIVPPGPQYDELRLPKPYALAVRIVKLATVPPKKTLAMSLKALRPGMGLARFELYRQIERSHLFPSLGWMDSNLLNQSNYVVIFGVHAPFMHVWPVPHTAQLGPQCALFEVTQAPPQQTWPIAQHEPLQHVDNGRQHLVPQHVKGCGQHSVLPGPGQQKEPGGQQFVLPQQVDPG